MLSTTAMAVPASVSPSAPPSASVDVAAAAASLQAVQNSTYFNPILPGFHPDPSCIHVADSDSNGNSPGTFFCVSSSFSAFPGIPIHASRDLRKWTLIGHVLNRPSQLPELTETSRSTSGIWAPTLRYYDGTFYVVTTLVKDEKPQSDSSRWDNLIFQADDPYDPASWTNPVRFKFNGYDASPFWDDNGRSYIVASHAWQVKPGIQLAEVDFDTGETETWSTIWTGTGGRAPEGPHIYRKDGYYYLLIAEGGTGLGHEVTMARSKRLTGPYEPHPSNPVLTNANTTEYFQTVGHADLVEDAAGNWWAVALATRSGPAYVNYPMGRETVLTSVQWENGTWPRFSPVRGTEMGPLPAAADVDDDDDGEDGYARELNGDDLDFSKLKALPPHFTYWRPPVVESYGLVVPSASNASKASSSASNATVLRLLPSKLNLTGLDGNSAAGGQTFVGRRQQHTLFTYRVDVTYQPAAHDEEAGVTVFLTQNHHLDLGVVRLEDGAAAAAHADAIPYANSSSSSSVPHTAPTSTHTHANATTHAHSSASHAPTAATPTTANATHTHASGSASHAPTTTTTSANATHAHSSASHASAPTSANATHTHSSSSSSSSSSSAHHAPTTTPAARPKSSVYLRFRGITAGPAAQSLPAAVTVPVPASWHDAANADAPLRLTLQIQAANATHYSFAAWPTAARSEARTVAWASNSAVSYGFTGALLGVYATSNGGSGSAPLEVGRWLYVPEGQFRD